MATLHEVHKLPTKVNETYGPCLRGAWIIIIIDPLGSVLSLCHIWLAGLGKNYYICRILKAKGKSEKKKNPPILTTQYSAVLWFKTDAGEEVEFIVWRRVLAPEKKILFKF